ncbi:hypothetical protein NKH18_51625 [Streptomyces sp. M10(2022)]
MVLDRHDDALYRIRPWPPTTCRPAGSPCTRSGHHQRDRPRPRPSRRPGQTAPASGPLPCRPSARLGSRCRLDDRPAREPADRPARPPPHRPPRNAPPAATRPHRYPPDLGLPPPSPSAALHQALRTTDYSITADFGAARRHYYGTPITEPRPQTNPPGRQTAGSPCPHWTASSPTTAPPCAAPCTPPRSPSGTAHHPCLSPRAPPSESPTGCRGDHYPAWQPPLPPHCSPAPLQQLATARPRLRRHRGHARPARPRPLHRRLRRLPVPPWAGTFLRAAACFTRLASGEDQELLTVPGDRGHLLRMAETARLRPPSRPRSAAKARSAV